MSNCRKELCGITTVEPHSTVLPTVDAGAPQSLVVRIPQQAESDEQLIRLWLHGRSKHTIKGYTNDINLFNQKVNTSLQTTTLQDLQNYADYITEKNYAPVYVFSRSETKSSLN